MTSQVHELPREECLRLLGSGTFGRLAVNSGDDVPVIRPVNYAFDERSQSVVFRTLYGSKLQALLGSARAAFEIDGIDPESRTGWSVIIVGTTAEVTNPTEIRRLESLGLDPWVVGETSRWIRIRAWTVTGRRIARAAAA